MRQSLTLSLIRGQFSHGVCFSGGEQDTKSCVHVGVQNSPTMKAFISLYIATDEGLRGDRSDKNIYKNGYPQAITKTETNVLSLMLQGLSEGSCVEEIGAYPRPETPLCDIRVDH